MTEHKTDPGLGALPGASGGSEPEPPKTPSASEPLHFARYTTDPRAPLTPEIELLRGLRDEDAPVLKGLRDIVEATHDFQDVKKARAAAVIAVRKEHAAEKAVLKAEPEPPSMTTEPGARAKRREGIRQLVVIGLLCVGVGIVFLLAVTRTPKTNLAPPATSATATAVHAAPTVTSDPVALTASPVPSVPPTVPPAPSTASAASPNGPTHLPHMPSSPHTSAIGPSNTEPTQVQEPIPVPATPASAGAPNPWKIKEH